MHALALVKTIHIEKQQNIPPTFIYSWMCHTLIKQVNINYKTAISFQLILCPQHEPAFNSLIQR